MPHGLHIRLTVAEDMPTFERALGRNLALFYGRRMARGAAVLGAWLADQLIGAICISAEPADEWIVKILLWRVPLLYRLQVVPEHRDHGYGTELLMRAEAYLKDDGHRRVALAVDESNVRPVNLYTRLGYREWRFGSVKTFREEYTEDGTQVRVRERCRMFVKSLA